MAQSHSGSFVLEVAELGERLTTAYTSFIVYRKVGDRRLENLYCTLAITTSKLNELGTTLNKYEKEVTINDHVTRPLVEQCKKNFDKFLQLMNEGNANGVWKNDGKVGGQAVTTELDPWFLITMGLGGREQTKTFWNLLDDTRNSLIELNDVVKYIVLKSLAKTDSLDAQGTQEYAKMKELLPHLVESVEKGAQIKKEEAVAATARLRRQQSRARSPFTPGFRRRCSTASSDMTLPVEPRPPICIDDDLKGRGRSRSRSVSSFSSMSSDNSFARQPEDPKVIYEEWVLRWNEPLKNLQRSSSFLGFKIKHYFENSGFWGTDPEYRSQEEMKEQEKFASADLSPAKHKEAMQKAIQAIPKKGGACIDGLLEERTEASNYDAKRVWTVVAVRPKQKFVYSSKKSWGKDRKTTDWLITIKGETIDTVERKRHLRWQNPFPERRNSRSRSYSPYPSRHGRARPIPRPRAASPFIVPNNYNYPVPSRHRARRPMSPLRPLPVRRRSPPRPVGIRPRNFSPVEEIEDYRVGNVVVGKILTVEKAEKKMDAIWAEMNVEKKEKGGPEVIEVVA